MISCLKFALAGCLVLFSTATFAATYKCESNGVITYQDQPCESSSKESVVIGKKPEMPPTPREIREKEKRESLERKEELLDCQKSAKCPSFTIERLAKIVGGCAAVEKLLGPGEPGPDTNPNDTVWEVTYPIRADDEKSRLRITCLDHEVVGASMTRRWNRYTGIYE